AEMLELLAEFTGLKITSAPTADGTTGPPLLRDPALRHMARTLENLMEQHLFYGQVFGVFYATTNKLPGTVVALDGAADSTLWSGVYLAAESFRYALARYKKSHVLKRGQVAVWEKEMERAKSRVLQVYAGTHRNINLSKNWNGSNAQGEPGVPF